jgi:hypothetical protein
VTAGTQTLVLALVRVERDAPRPDEEALRAALVADRARLRLPPAAPGDVVVVGPYPVHVDGRDLDEYVVWER